MYINRFLTTSLCCLLVHLLVLPSAFAQTETSPRAPNSPIREHFVTTLLGADSRASLGDPRLDATLNPISDYAFLPSGDMLVTHSNSGRVFRIGADGLLRPFAGTGSPISSGDGSAAVAAGVSSPVSIATTSTGVVYIHQGDGYLRRVDVDGTIHTIGGNGTNIGCAQDGVLALETVLRYSESLAADAAGNVYLAPHDCGAVYRIGADGRVSIAAGANIASLGRLNAVRDLAVDTSGNLLFSARISAQRVLYRLDTQGEVTRLLEESGSSIHREGPASDIRFPASPSMAVAEDGRLAVAAIPKIYSENVYRDTHELGLVGTDGNYSILFAGDVYGSKPTGQVGDGYVAPTRLRFHPSGELYAQDAKTGAIFRIRPDGTPERFVGTFEGDYFVETGASPRLSSSTIAFPNVNARGELTFVGRSGKMYRYGSDGALTHIAGDGESSSADDGPALERKLNVASITYDKAGNIYLSDIVSVKEGYKILIRRIDPQGMLQTIAGDGGIQGDWEGLDGRSAEFGLGVSGLTASPSGEVYFHTSERNRAGVIWKLRTDGKLTRVAGSGAVPDFLPFEEGRPALQTDLPRVDWLMVDDAGVLYFQVQLNGFAVYRIDAEGRIESVVEPAAGVRRVVDGGSTLTAALPFSHTPVSHAPGRFLAGGGGALAEYVAGGNVTVWASYTEGRAYADGLRVPGDKNAGNGPTVLLPDGSIAWVEWRQPYQLLRRSFPAPEGCNYTPSALTLSASAAGGSTGVGVSTASHCPWAIGASSHWIELPDQRQYAGDAQITLRFRENPSPQARTGYVYAAGAVIPVTQAGDENADLFTVTPSVADVPAIGGQVRVEIAAGTSTPWTIALPGMGITADGSLAGAGPAVRILTVPPLVGEAFRTMLVTVNGHTITIRQAQQQGTVPVDIVSMAPGASVVVDGQQHTLPYRAFWMPGSTHTIAMARFLRNGEMGLWQFRQWWDGNTSPERVYTVTGLASELHAEYRELLPVLLEAQVNGEPANTIDIPVFRSYLGVSVDATWKQQMGLHFDTAFYPKGQAVQVFSPVSGNTGFVRYRMEPLNGQGSSTTSERALVEIVVDRPMRVRAEFRRGPGEGKTRSLVLPPSYTLRYPKEVRNGNPIAFPVTASDGEPLREPAEAFVHYDGFSDDAPYWLQTRVSGPGGAPSVLELSVDAGAPEWQRYVQFGAGYRSVSVYLHSADVLSAHLKLHVFPFTLDMLPSERYVIVDAVTDAGGFRQVEAASPGSIITLFGSRFATETAQAQALPLPVELAGFSVSCTGVPGGNLPLFYVSPGQVNFLIPADWQAPGNGGAVSCTARAPGLQTLRSFSLQLERQTVSLFTANASGLGAPAGMAVWGRQDGSSRRELLTDCTGGSCGVKTLRRQPGEALYLELYGTGFGTVKPGDIRILLDGKDVPVAYAGAHAQFVGLCQLNLQAPEDVRTGQDLDLYVWVRGSTDSPWQSSNRLTLRFE